MSNEVGFSFQADVVNTGSLAHMLTGRVLKALSDGGVDTYAVAAAFWMGAKIPVRSSLADTVHAQISKRPSYQSVLSRALNIGWGHSTPVIEMTRTRAGTNGLLLVGAFATGVPAFQAAQSLSELLSVYDLGADMLPNVDVLKGLVKYLAPFVHDLGFSKVLQHITHVCESAIKIENYSERSVIREIGSPKILAAAVKQLVYTSQLHQDHYMILKVRGSWLPAFASHLLGMSFELRCRDKTIWASGGDNGSVVFQLAHDHMEQHSIQPFPASLTIVERAPDNDGDGMELSIDCALENVIDSQCLRWPQIDTYIAASIHAAVRRLSLDFLSRDHISSEIQDNQEDGIFPTTLHNPMPAVLGVKALERVLQEMNVKPQPQQWAESFPRVLQAKEKPTRDLRTKHKIGPATHGIGFMDQMRVTRMASRCERHHAEAHSVAMFGLTEDPTWMVANKHHFCLCERVGRLIYGCALMASSLARCNFDASCLRVQESVMNGQSETGWGQLFRGEYEFNDEGIYEQVEGSSAARSIGHLDHLCQLLCSDYDRSWTSHENHESFLGLSGGFYTIYYSCVMENDCYDDLGRMISIRTGRASVAGSFRNSITENFNTASCPSIVIDDGPDAMDDLRFSWLAGKCLLESHYLPPRSRAFMDVALQEKTISLRLRFNTETESMSTWGFMYCIRTFLVMWLVPKCFHPQNSIYEVPTNHTVGVGGLYLEQYLHKHSRGKVALFALKGNKLEQLLACGVGYDKLVTTTRDGSKRYGVLQLHACLKCCIGLAQKSEVCHPYVVMGG